MDERKKTAPPIGRQLNQTSVSYAFFYAAVIRFARPDHKLASSSGMSRLDSLSGRVTASANRVRGQLLRVLLLRGASLRRRALYAIVIS